MIKKYFITEHCFSNKETKFVNFVNYYEGLALVEELATNLVNKMEGTKHSPIKIYNINDTGRPFSYFIEKNPNHFHKLTVRQKVLEKGVLFNSIKFMDIVEYNLVSVYINNYSEYNPCLDSIINSIMNDDYTQITCNTITKQMENKQKCLSELLVKYFPAT